MNITRRVLMTGLAAALSVIRFPAALATENLDFPEDAFDDNDCLPYIEYLEVGEGSEMLGGPATTPGWYLHPDCMIGCCASLGPFASREAAEEADRLRWEEIARDSRKRGAEKRKMKEIKY